MKKIIAMLALVLMTTVALFGCGNSSVYQAVEATDVENEQYGFIVSKTSDSALLTAINKVVDELVEDDKVNELITYHTDKHAGDTPEALSFTIPDTSNNTGGTLTMATNAEFAPFEYKLSTEVEGVDIDIMSLVAEELDLKLEINNVDFDAVFTQVSAGVADIGASGITITDERKETFNFSNAYVNSVQYIICTEDQTYSKISDLAGLTIGVQQATTGDIFCSEEIADGSLTGTGAKVLTYKSGALAFLALKSGQVDVVVLDKLPAQSIVNNQ